MILFNVPRNNSKKVSGIDENIDTYPKYCNYVKRLRDQSTLIESTKRNKKTLTLKYLKGDDEIYNHGLDLITNCEHSIKALINGGIDGKAPKEWFERVSDFLKLRNLHHSKPVDFEIIILCTPEELKSEGKLTRMKTVQENLERLGIADRFIRRIVCQEVYWLGPDFLIIDSQHLILNWLIKYDRHTKSNTTHRGILISNPEIVESFRRFFEQVIWEKGLDFQVLLSNLK